MREQVFCRLKVGLLLLLFLVPVWLMHWSQRLQSQLERQAYSVPPAAEFAQLQFVEEDGN